MKKFNQTFIRIFLLGMWVFLSGSAFGQRPVTPDVDFLTLIAKPTNISPQRNTFLNRLVDDKTTKGISYMMMEDLPRLVAKDGTLKLRMPGLSEDFVFFPTHYELKANGDYVWFGKLDADKGYGAVIKQEGYVGGFVQTHDAFWEMFTLSSNTVVVRELDIADFRNETCGIEHILSEYDLADVQSSMVDLCNENGGCGGIIDVLILVPPDVTAWYGTLNGSNGSLWAAISHVLGSLYSFQFALVNSGIEDISLRFTTASITFPYSNPPRINTDLYTTLPNIATGLRASFRADLVVLLTTRNYGAIRGGATVGELSGDELIWLSPCNDCAFIISPVQNNVNPTWTLAHELAHLFGARHNRNANVPCGACGDNANICSHGFRFSDDGGLDRTIMALLFNDVIAQGSGRALQFSNPDVLFDGFVTGTNNDNNARAIRNATCAVMNYQASPLLGVTIAGNGGPLCGFGGTVYPRTYTANIIPPATNFPGLPPFTYEWRWSQNGNFTATDPGVLLGTASSVYIGTVYGTPQFFLSLQITSSDGVVARAARRISTALCFGDDPLVSQTNGLPEAIDVGSESKLQSGSEIGYIVSPNPTTSNLQIKPVHLLPSTVGYKVRIYDVIGRLLLEQEAENGEEISIDTSPFATGPLLLRIDEGANVQFFRIVKFGSK